MVRSRSALSLGVLWREGSAGRMCVSLDDGGCFVNCLRPIDENDYFLLFLSNVCIFPFKAAVSCLIKEYWPVLQILTDLADPPGTSFCGRVLEQVCL